MKIEIDFNADDTTIQIKLAIVMMLALLKESEKSDAKKAARDERLDALMDKVAEKVQP